MEAVWMCLLVLVASLMPVRVGAWRGSPSRQKTRNNNVLEQSRAVHQGRGGQGFGISLFWACACQLAALSLLSSPLLYSTLVSFS